MIDEDSVPVAAVAGVMAVGGVIAAMAVDQAFAVSQMLDPVMVGREAAIMHLVLRGAIKNASLCGCLMLAFWRCWRGQGKWWRNWRPMALPLKVGLAALAACSLGGCLTRLWLWFVPALALPVEALGGWRGLQLVDLAMQCGFTLLLYALANWIQRKIESARSAAIRVAFAALAVCLFGGLASPAPYWIVGKVMSGRSGETIDAGEEEKSSPNDDYRLDADEPWEMISYSSPFLGGRREVAKRGSVFSGTGPAKALFLSAFPMPDPPPPLIPASFVGFPQGGGPLNEFIFGSFFFRRDVV